MADPAGPRRTGLEPQALHYSYEKAGLILDDQPIPWNADAVLVEARLRLAGTPPGWQDDFSLLYRESRIRPESLHPGEDGVARLGFRLNVPNRAAVVELFYKTQSLGQMTLPFLSEADFQSQLVLSLTTLAVKIGGETVSCHTFVPGQVKEMFASAVVTARTSLAPLVELPLTLRRTTGSQENAVTAVRLSASQLRSRQALVTVSLPKPKRTGLTVFAWHVGEQSLGNFRVHAMGRPGMLRSLRLSATRIVLQRGDGDVEVVRALTDGVDYDRLAPCFWVSSFLAGLAGSCEFVLLAHSKGERSPVEIARQDFLVTDGPTPILMGTLAREAAAQMQHFELRVQNRSLGVVSLEAAPEARFDSEGGFQATEDFSWSSQAEEQLREKLGRLLG